LFVLLDLFCWILLLLLETSLLLLQLDFCNAMQFMETTGGIQNR
jgi:hypothetical protein